MSNKLILKQQEAIINDCRTKRMGYIEWHDFADNNIKNGIEQSFCIVCNRYKFPSERCKLFKDG